MTLFGKKFAKVAIFSSLKGLFSIRHSFEPVWQIFYSKCLIINGQNSNKVNLSHWPLRLIIGFSGLEIDYVHAGPCRIHPHRQQRYK